MINYMTIYEQEANFIQAVGFSDWESGNEAILFTSWVL